MFLIPSSMFRSFHPCQTFFLYFFSSEHNAMVDYSSFLMPITSVLSCLCPVCACRKTSRLNLSLFTFFRPKTVLVFTALEKFQVSNSNLTLNIAWKSCHFSRFRSPIFQAISNLPTLFKSPFLAPPSLLPVNELNFHITEERKSSGSL